ncbi:MAG: TolB family protein, partial [Pirellulales bacterium]
LRFESLEERTLLDGGAGDAGGAGASLEAVAAGRLAYHSYTDYGVDGELHVWNFSDAAADTRAEGTVNARVRYAMNPQFSGNGRYLVLMGVDRQLPKAWPNLDVFIYDFRTDTVTNLTEALVGAGFLTAGNDWIDEDPSFDPTSLTIAFKRRSGGSSDLWSMKLDGTAQTPIALTRLTNTPSTEESGPKFSPDGQTIVCWVGVGPSSYIGSLPAAGGAVAVVVDNANRQDYYPSYWGDGRILYTSWDTNGNGDDDIRVRDLATGADAFGLGGFHSPAEDSDAFAISPTLVGFSSSYQSADGKWRLRYGNPTTGETAALPFHTANKHDLGGTYTPHVVSYVPGPERSELPGDYSHNLLVDAADYTVWRDTLGSTVDLRADASGSVIGVPDGVVDEHDFAFWKASFGNSLGEGSGAIDAGDELRAVETHSNGGRVGSDVQVIAGELRLAGELWAAAAGPVGPARRSSPAIVPGVAGAARGIDGALLEWFAGSSDRVHGPAETWGPIFSAEEAELNIGGSNGPVDSAFAEWGPLERERPLGCFGPAIFTLFSAF